MRFNFSAIRQRWFSQSSLNRCLLVAFLGANLSWLFLFKMMYSSQASTSLHYIQEKQTYLSNQLVKTEQRLQQFFSLEEKQQQRYSQQWVALQQQLNELQQNTKNLVAYHESLQRIESLQQTCLTKLNQVNPVHKATDTVSKPAPAISEQVLPFSVLGIDIWNGVPKITVRLQKQLNLLGVNDALAGWTLVQVMPEAGSAVFQNAQHQQVKVTL